MLWPGNADAWRLWQACRTQWRPQGFGGWRPGLDYKAVVAVADVLGVEMDELMLEKIQHLERDALNALTKEEAKQREQH